MEKVRVEDAVGMVLCHDITEIVPGKFKGRAFAKGHIIEEKDIEKLLDLANGIFMSGISARDMSMKMTRRCGWCRQWPGIISRSAR